MEEDEEEIKWKKEISRSGGGRAGARGGIGANGIGEEDSNGLMQYFSIITTSSLSLVVLSNDKTGKVKIMVLSKDGPQKPRDLQP